MQDKRKTTAIIILSVTLALSVALNAIFVYRKLGETGDRTENFGTSGGSATPDPGGELTGGSATPDPGGESSESNTSPEVEITEVVEGGKAPDFSVAMLNGEVFTLSKHKGKVVFLNFWATWCPPCIAEMPAIQELSEKYENEVVFIGVDVAEDSLKVQDFIDREGYTYNIGLDSYGDLIRDVYPTDGIPYTIVIDADGIIVRIFLGGGARMHEIFENAIIKALGG